MAIKKVVSHRLARNFHRTFVPERQYLGALLKYAAGDAVVEMQLISEETGIPTGASSGKVMPTADYCRGMGLLTVLPGKEKRFQLTSFGRTVLLEDPFFREPITQWIAHLQLCHHLHGAEVWYQTFCQGATVLGQMFTRDSLDSWLATAMHVTSQNLIGPLVRMYEDDASFGLSAVLTSDKTLIRRNRAPLDHVYAYGYGAWICSLIDDAGRNGAQITVDELEMKCGWRSIAGWNLKESHDVLGMLEQKQILVVDRQMNPWIIQSRSSAESLWRRLYDNLI